jgi:Bacterial lectin
MRTSLAAITTALIGLTAVATPAAAAPARDRVISYGDFSDASGLVLNGTATVEPADTGRDVLRLTSGRLNQAGSAWSKTKINPARSFQTTFEVAMTGSVRHADGVAFVLQTDGAEAVGGHGGSIGYGGLSHSVAVELDTYANPADIDNNHVALVTAGRAADPQDAVPAPTPLFGQTLRVRITYDAASQVLKVRLRPATGGPEAKVLTRDLNLKAELGTKRVWAGFTAATGESVSTQEIHNWSVRTLGRG